MLDEVLNVNVLGTIFPYFVWISLFVCFLLWLINCFYVLCATPIKEDDNPENRRAMIRHENDLINNRLTWLMTAQGLLFATLGFALSKDNAAIAKQLIPILSFLGVVLAASASIALDGADTAIVKLSGRSFKGDLDVIGYRGVPYVEWLISLFKPWRIYPPMLIVAWLMISQIQIKEVDPINKCVFCSIDSQTPISGPVNQGCGESCTNLIHK